MNVKRTAATFVVGPFLLVGIVACGGGSDSSKQTTRGTEAPLRRLRPCHPRLARRLSRPTCRPRTFPPAAFKPTPRSQPPNRGRSSGAT